MNNANYNVKLLGGIGDGENTNASVVSLLFRLAMSYFTEDKCYSS